MKKKITIGEYMRRKAEIRGISLYGTFELTPCCNFNCRMCYVKKTREEAEALGGMLSPEQWIEFGEYYSSQGMLELLLTGGEPLLYKGFRQVYEALHRMGLVISINTNGSLIDDEILELFKAMPPFRVSITLYGCSADTYGKLCGNPSMYERVLRNIRRLKEAGVHVRINAILSPYNAADAGAIYQTAAGMELPFQYTTYIFPTPRREDSSIGCANRFRPEEAAECWLRMEGRYMTREQMQERARAVQNYDFSSFEKTERCEGEGDRGVLCAAGKCSFWMNWRGEMLACGICDYPRSYPLAEGYKEAWEKLKEETARLRMPKQCCECSLAKACNVCLASCLAENGNLTEAPEYQCRRTRRYLELLKERYLPDDESSEEQMTEQKGAES